MGAAPLTHPHSAHQLQGCHVCDNGRPCPQVSDTSYYSSYQPGLSFFLNLLLIPPSYEALNYFFPQGGRELRICPEHGAYPLQLQGPE